MIVRWHKVTFLIAIGIISAASVANAAEGDPDPNWVITSSHPPNDTYNYLVTNISEPGDSRNLVQVTIPAGTNHGVHTAFALDYEWTVTINENATIFEGDGFELPPGDDEAFNLDSTVIDTVEDYVIGDAAGPPQGLQFPPDLVIKPALIADLDLNGIITTLDLALIALDWLNGPGNYTGDISGDSGSPDGYVDLFDFVKVYEQWLMEDSWYLEP